MPKRDKLFLLVKSLTKSEKRYFSIYTQMHIKGDDNDYMKLFKEFERQEVLDEEQIKDNLKHEKLMDHYAVTKSYLYDLILKAMRSYTKHSITKRILDLLQDVEFLYTKGIFDQALQLVKKAKELALESGSVSIREEILSWERTIYQASSFSLTNQEQLAALKHEQVEVSELQKEQHQLWNACAELSVNVQYGKGKAHDMDTTIQTLSNKHAQVLNDEQANERDVFYASYLQILNARIEGDKQASLKGLNNIIAYFEASEQRKLDNAYLYTRAIADRLALEIELDAIKEAQNTIQQIGKMTPILELNFYFEAWAFFVTRAARLQIMLKRDANAEALRMVNEIKEGMKKYAPFLTTLREVEFYLYFGVFHLRLGEFNDADDYFNTVIRESDESVHQQLMTAAWFLRAKALVEGGNLKKLPTLTERALNYYKKNKPSNAIEEAVAELFESVDGKESVPDLRNWVENQYEKYCQAVQESNAPFYNVFLDEVRKMAVSAIEA